MLLYYFLSTSHAGMIVIDNKGNVAGGTSTNGLNHKIPGFVFLFVISSQLIHSESHGCFGWCNKPFAL